MSLARAIQLVSALTVALLVATDCGPAIAAEGARTPFQQSVEKACIGSPCRLAFSPVAANRREYVRYVSCQVTASGGVTFGSAQVGISNVFGANAFAHVVPWQKGVSEGNEYIFSTPMLFFVPAGKRAEVGIAFFNDVNANGANLTCTIAGDTYVVN